ncbi:hypothetical protein N7488_004371 [Penicillium malachiteum]|nr:hypothetical protein N7488_004371 [Penicillium malachiteum]
MAPLRRYLRITKYSVLECRIYLENPSDNRWLLDSPDPALPRVFAAVRPLVLPKLREENERRWTRKKSKATKDVITEDDFEVGIFLRESRSRHSLLTRNKTFHKPTKDEDAENAADQLGDSAQAEDAEIVIDSDSEREIDLRNIPEATEDDESVPNTERPSRKRKRKAEVDLDDTQSKTDEKKLGFTTHYEGFSISGWVLCLLVARKGDRARAGVNAGEPNQPLMEHWISTQAEGVSAD